MSAKLDAYSQDNPDDELSRRRFIRISALVAAGTQLPWLTGCSDNKEPTLSFEQSVLDFMFPHDETDPGALDFLTDKYIFHIMEDPEEPEQYRKNLARGFTHIKDVSHGNFHLLDEDRKTEILEEMNQEDWSRLWLKRIMILILESMLIDPSYGYNPDGVGYAWLNHVPGKPSPTPDTTYPKLYQQIYHG